MNNNLKIYTCDLNWAGSIVVVATSLEEARIYMETQGNYKSESKYKKVEIKEFPICGGFIHCDNGEFGG